MKKMQNMLMAVSLSLVILVIVWGFLPSDLVRVTSAQPLNISEYESRKVLLSMRATQPFSDDPLRNISTTLDLRSFDQINKLNCPKPINKSEGWSVEFRTGGRPFMNYDTIQVRDKLWGLVRCTPGNSDIPQSELDSHYDQAGKKVNRLWFIHKATEGSYPTVVVMTSDGFFNVAGAESPKLQGAATRIGFIGEPFSLEKDYLQHVDNVNITEVDTYTIKVVYDIHSEAGEGVLEVELKWITATLQPELHLRSAHVSRLSTSVRLGFAGFDFMRGPTLSGLLYNPNKPTGEQISEDGIEAFHDGRSVFVVPPGGPIIAELLAPPVMTSTVISKDLTTGVVVGSELVMDQPQDIKRYFSKHPSPPYEIRTDLILKLNGSNTEPISVRRVQQTVDLTGQDPNPEANETVNVFFAASMADGQLYEFSFTLEPAASNFESLYWKRRQGVVFVSDRLGKGMQLYFLPLDKNYSPSPAEPLTDGTIVDAHRPSVSSDKRFIIFDADDYKMSIRQRVYTLDLASGAIRRLTLDPFGNSNDYGASLSSNGSEFAMITNRKGPLFLNIENVGSGLGEDTGNSVINGASSADWSHSRNELVYATNSGLSILDRETKKSVLLVAGSGIKNPKFSPCPVSRSEKIAYVFGNDIHLVNRDGSDNKKVLSNGDYPTWVSESQLIFQRTASGNTDLYLANLDTGETTRLTTNQAVDAEPVFIIHNCTYLPIIPKNR